MNFLEVLIIAYRIDCVLGVWLVSYAGVDHVFLFVFHDGVGLFLVFEHEGGVLVELPEEDVGVVAPGDETAVVI